MVGGFHATGKSIIRETNKWKQKETISAVCVNTSPKPVAAWTGESYQ